MRTIKYRAWDKNGKAMVYPELINDNHFNIYAWCDSESEESILMQFTGLFDKNGKEIYEGDIVQWWDSYGVPELGNDRFTTDAEVEFKGGAFYPVCEIPLDELEVIGNIHENPELLNLPDKDGVKGQ